VHANAGAADREKTNITANVKISKRLFILFSSFQSTLEYLFCTLYYKYYNKASCGYTIPILTACQNILPGDFRD